LFLFIVAQAHLKRRDASLTLQHNKMICSMFYTYSWRGQMEQNKNNSRV